MNNANIKLKNLYDLEHQRIINSSNIWHIVLATLTVSFLFTKLPDALNKVSLLMKIEAILAFIIALLILKLFFDSKIRELEDKIKELGTQGSAEYV